MAVWATVNVLAALTFSLGDLSEDATDQLVVLQK
jgi:hypothetical protein